jgi:uncharacterized protein
MGTKVRTAVFALATVMLVGAAAAPERGARTSPPAAGPQEVEVVAVAVDPQSQVPAVVLRGKRDQRHIMMSIGVAEATGIALPLQGITPPRPLTHDLFLTLFGRLNVALTRVVITDLRDDVFYAVLHLTANGAAFSLDSRPSDAIALAIRAKVPVFVEDRVFDKAGRPPAPAGPHI